MPLIILYLLVGGVEVCIGQELKDTSSPIFELLDSEQTGVDFNNVLQPDLSTNANLFDFDYFYNGAGVGILDYNKDGLQDIFFCGNQVGDRLFKNLGNMRFEDVTDKVNMVDIPGWSNGVSIVDINQDGWVDIYVSRGGPQAGLSRRNLLWINHRGQYFSDEADTYGLGDRGLSTQSVFFDYDRDGDLDCFVMNENEYYGHPPLDFYNRVGVDSTAFYNSSSHLYQNTNNGFVDVSIGAGILRPSFGLGVSVVDIDEDGWLDLYMSNDYFIPEALFINQKNGTFKEEGKKRFQQMPFYGMGVDIADLDNDGDQDIFVLDMAFGDHYRSKKLMRSMNVDNFNFLVKTLGLPYQYMYNALQLNNGMGAFDNIAQYGGVAKTGWSWAAILEDLDNDGLRDIYVTTGYRKYGMDNDFQQRVKAIQATYEGQVPLMEKKKLYNSMWSERWPNVAFRNGGDMKFEDKAEAWGLSTPSYSNGAAIADLNNDGLIDIVVNNIDHDAFIYKGKRTDQHWINIDFSSDFKEDHPTVRLYAKGVRMMNEVRRVRGYFSSSQPLAHFGLGAIDHIDSITIAWSEGRGVTLYDVPVDTNIVYHRGNTIIDLESAWTIRSGDHSILKAVDPEKLGLVYRHKENPYDDFREEVLLPYKQSTLGPPLVAGDINGDGREDLIVGGAYGQATTIFINGKQGFNHFIPQSFYRDMDHEDGGFTLFDMDKDGDLDLFVVSAGNAEDKGDSMYYDRLYVNPGNGDFRLSRYFADSIPYNSGVSAEAMDINQDGRMDIVVGNRIIPHEYPQAAASYILVQTDTGWIENTEELAPEWLKAGIVNDMLVSDFDGDGIKDLISVGEWGAPHFYRCKDGNLKEVTAEMGVDNLKGWWWSITTLDYNNDGRPDYLLGNAGLNMKYKASASNPFEIFAGDMDENKTWDVVLAHQEGDHVVPVRGKECSSQQMPFIKEKFKTYDAYASATLSDIYGEKLGEVYKRNVNTFQSILLVSKKGKGYEILPLPWEAQLFPITDGVAADFDGDGQEELFVIGNEFNTEAETPRWDAGHGLILESQDKGGLRVMKSEKGWLVKGNYKHIQTLRWKEKEHLLILTENNGRLSCFTYKTQ